MSIDVEKKLSTYFNEKAGKLLSISNIVSIKGQITNESLDPG